MIVALQEMQDVGQKLHQLKLQLDNAGSSTNSEPSSHNSRRHLKRKERHAPLTENAVATPEP